jgi:ABC-type glycerol-3-phosphate transport system substrate-binding protein
VPRLLLGLLVVALLAGCGGSGDDATEPVKVYLLRDGMVWPVSREIETTGISQLDDQLKRGPTESEKELGFTTEVAGGSNLSRAALAQMVYTFTQFDPAKAVEIDGKTYTRADFEQQTPLILVESPLPFAQVSSPLRATGTANTFEATFQYELLDGDGKVIDKNFVTATSGTGTRGTFDFTAKDVDDMAALVVYENSAEDGSRIHEARIPLTASS